MFGSDVSVPALSSRDDSQIAYPEETRFLCVKGNGPGGAVIKFSFKRIGRQVRLG